MKKFVLSLVVLLSFFTTYAQNEEVKSFTKDKTITEIQSWIKVSLRYPEQLEIKNCELIYSRLEETLEGIYSLKSIINVKNIGKIQFGYDLFHVSINCENNAECIKDIVDGKDEGHKDSSWMMDIKRGGVDGRRFIALITHLKSFCN